MADFEERHLKISFDELNTKLNNCIQKILKASFMENKDSVNDFEICLNEYSQLRKDFQEQGFCYDENLCGHFDKEAEENVQLRAFKEEKAGIKSISKLEALFNEINKIN